MSIDYDKGSKKTSLRMMAEYRMEYIRVAERSKKVSSEKRILKKIFSCRVKVLLRNFPKMTGENNLKL